LPHGKSGKARFPKSCYLFQKTRIFISCSFIYYVSLQEIGNAWVKVSDELVFLHTARAECAKNEVEGAKTSRQDDRRDNAGLLHGDACLLKRKNQVKKNKDV